MTKFKMGDEVLHEDYGYGIIINVAQQPIVEQVYGVMFGNLTCMIEESELEFKQHSLWDDENFKETFDEHDDEELTPQKIKVVTDEDLETIFVQINKKITIAFTVVYNKLAVGISSKSPNDEWDDETGKALAYLRANKQ